jgi:hexosaminidase
METNDRKPRRRRWGRAVAVVLTLAAPAAVSAAPAPTVMPAPASIQVAGQAVVIGDNWVVVWKGRHDPLMKRAAARFLERLSLRVGHSIGSDPRRPHQNIEIDCARQDAGAPMAPEDERYSLVVDGDRVRIQASSDVGVLRALASLAQLAQPTPAGFAFPAVRIEDQPRFAWRGLMIDTARHFIPVAALKRQLDAMELVKLNVLHLHLSDNEGFRVESRVFPKLQSADGFYTQGEIRDLVAYAADRGIRVVPEFDVPGHARAWLRAYPELRGDRPAPAGAEPVFGDDSLDPSREETYAFVERLFGEMSRLFPDAYFHIGGDEVNGMDWAKSPSVTQFKAAKGFANNAALQAYFTGRVREILAKNGKTMIGWDEVLRPDLDKGVVVEAWRSAKLAARAAEAGHPVISAGGYYLDRMPTAGTMYAIDPADPAGFGLTPAMAGQIAKTPFAMAFPKEAYAIDETLRLDPAPAGRIMGGEAAMWTELVTGEMIDDRVWPRAAAVAERLWSPATMRDEAEMYRRLLVLDEELETFGLQRRASRAQMLARLQVAPDPAVERFLDVVEPVKNLAHWKTLRAGFRSVVPQSFDELADIAPAESLTARRFALDVDAFLAAPDPEKAEVLKTQLALWRDNHRAFAAAAERSPALREALPVSADLAALAEAGLASVDAIVAGRSVVPTAERTALLQGQDAWREASATPFSAFTHRQPPADLLIAVAPAIRRLVDSVERTGAAREAAR